MIVLLGASSIVLTALQASINAPTTAFRGCLREAATKASGEKVAPDGIEDYLKAQCSAQMESLKSAVVSFRVKNGMARKAAVEDANVTVEDYLAAPVDKYKFTAEMNAAPAPAAAAPAASAPTQQPAAPTSNQPQSPKP